MQKTKFKKNIIIDIGANFGFFTFDAAKKNKNIKFIAIEPIKECIDHLKKSSFDNVEIIEKCISNNNGYLNLNINSTGDLGLTSLLELNDKRNENNYWKIRSDVVETNIKKTQVEAITLEKLLENEEFSEIAFIKIDVQGYDLVCLESAGKFLNKIQAGVLEASATKKTRLYENQPVLFDVIGKLEELNFQVDSIKPNDPASNEFNVYFSRKDINLYSHLKKLNLLTNPIIEKQYVHYFSSKVNPPIIFFNTREFAKKIKITKLIKFIFKKEFIRKVKVLLRF